MAGQRWRVAVLCLAAATSVVLAVAPVLSWSSCETSAGGTSACTSGVRSLLDAEGGGVLVVLAVPVLLAAVPVAMRTRRASAAAAAGLTVAALLGAASIGLAYVPTAVLAWVAARAPSVARGQCVR
ncbi:MAG TPA: hypothetical protein VFJ85_07630 [Acidimicrobiales bacterium]|nr:hypothetical protein [Acidimicrobiales bacterium]